LGHFYDEACAVYDIIVSEQINEANQLSETIKDYANLCK